MFHWLNMFDRIIHHDKHILLWWMDPVVPYMLYKTHWWSTTIVFSFWSDLRSYNCAVIQHNDVPQNYWQCISITTIFSAQNSSLIWLLSHINAHLRMCMITVWQQVKLSVDIRDLYPDVETRGAIPLRCWSSYQNMNSMAHSFSSSTLFLSDLAHKFLHVLSPKTGINVVYDKSRQMHIQPQLLHRQTFSGYHCETG